MLRKRVLTSIIGIPLLVLAIFFQNPWFPIAISVIGLTAGYEFYRIVRELGIKPITYFSLFAILLLILSPFCPIPNLKSIILTGTIIITLIWQVVTAKNKNAFSDWVWTITGIIYIGWTLSYWTALTNVTNSCAWILWAIAIVMACDAAAFFVGRAWGKHALAAQISPKKTWEGAIGGLFGSIFASVILGLLLPLPIPWWQMILVSIIISVIAQFGDLAESLLKRTVNVKDSGNLLPGHGGMLDRIDSYIFIGALVYFYIIYIVS